MENRVRRLLSTSILFLVVAGTGEGARAADSPGALANSEATVGRTVGNYQIVDQDWELVPFHSLRGKVILLTFFYIDCHGPCFLINDSLRRVMAGLDADLADGVTGLSVTIDAENDTPGELRTYGGQFTPSFDRWRFVSADRETLAKMTADLGFSYQKGVIGFEHLNRMTLIGPDGTVAAHFYGVDYDPAEVNAAVRSLLEGRPLGARLSDVASKLMLYCSSYDPVTKTYRINGPFVAAILVQYLLIMGTLLFLARRPLMAFGRRLVGAVRGASVVRCVRPTA
ncbi:MAG: SCO family protein [Nitrospinae bacterium]|nr:SCO family protein [Nitrospinota bacterium]